MDAVVGMGADLDLTTVLRRIIETATELVGATYGALGVLGPDGRFLSEFITVGMTEDEVAAIGPPPEGHGLLGHLVVHPEPVRVRNLSEHPDAYGFPAGHAPMTSFLGVPLFVHGQVFGNLYLTDKRDGPEFTETDEELAVGLAAAAAVAIDNARLHARLREVDLVEDRERIARDLHDTVIQRLFATGLSLQRAGRLTDRPEAVERIHRAIDDLDDTVREIRSVIFELQPRRIGRASLRRDLLAVGAEMVTVLGIEPRFTFDGPLDSVADTELAGQVVAVVREGLANVARHAHADAVAVCVTARDGLLVAQVDDDGVGPGPMRPGGHGMSNLQARAGACGGTSQLQARVEGGSRLVWQVPIPT